MTNITKGKIAIALSGGVDSAVAGALLLQEGWNVIGVTLKMQNALVSGCSSRDGLEQAGAIAQQLGIQHFVVDCVDDFERLVLCPAWDEYASGRTPSPCLWCNERLKFGILLDWAIKNGCDALATGHYVKLAACSSNSSQMRLLRGDDRNKDQSYFLAGLAQEQLSRLVFPLGGMDKALVRKMASELGLQCAKRKDSQDACFMLPEKSFPESLATRFGNAITLKKGFIIDWKGVPLAQHEGLHNFTIGQRRGVKVGTGAKAWVCRLDTSAGDVYLTAREEDLLCNEIRVSGLSWTSGEPPEMPLKCQVQVRYRSLSIDATLIEISDGCRKIILDKPARAVTPGQAVVFYDGDCVLGRGWIEVASRS